MSFNKAVDSIEFMIPVMLSQRMRDVMMRPNGANRVSNSLWHIVFGMPLTYKLAPLMFSLLGRANETYW